jgi:hypothetical protein
LKGKVVKQLFFVLLVLPIAVQAQYRFDPIRLDDGLDGAYDDVQFVIERNGDIRCTWTAETPASYRICSRRVAPSGQLLGDVLLYAEEPRDTLSGCLPYLRCSMLNSGGEVRLFRHA